jgi:4-methyl-5(b-hydroxyethyl)-thiazole monophosphate biosynthesis
MRNVLLLLANGYETYEASVFIDVIGWNLIDGDKSTKLFSCGLTKEINSSFNQKCIVDYLAEEINIDDYDALAIPGGFEEFNFYDDAYDERFLDVIRDFQKQNKLIASICVAALSLGKSGILKGRFATTYNKKAIRQDTLKEFGVIVKNEPVVIDGNIITCWNPSTAIDVAYLLLERLTTKENTNYIKTIMGFEDKIHK